MTRDDIIRMALEHFGAVLKPSDLEVKLAVLAVEAERKKVAEENAELLQALQNLHQASHWSDAPEEMDAAKAAIEKAIRARGEQLREALKTYGQHRNNCAAVLGGYQCTCGFNQQEQTR